MSLSLINIAGALNAMLVAVVLVLHPRLRKSSATRYLAGVLAIGAVVITLITLEHAELLWPTGFLLWLEEWLSLLAGALLLGYVTQSVLGRHPPRAVHLPWLFHLGAWLVSGAEIRGWLRIEHVMWVQMAYTAAGAAVWLRTRRRAGRAVPDHVAFILGMFIAVHLAQVLRLFWSDVSWLADVVPWVSSAAFFALIAYAVVESRTLAGLVAPVRGAECLRRNRSLATRLESVMREQRPWQDPGLTLERLAALTGCAPAELSAVLNRHLGVNFYDYLSRYRVAEAERLLTDPDERRFSVDGIGLQAGFGSRSGFYKLFKAQTGLSPAEYRRRHHDG